MLGMLLVAVENLQAGFQETLELGVAGRGNEQAFERAIHLFMVGHFIVDIGLVEGGTP